MFDDNTQPCAELAGGAASSFTPNEYRFLYGVNSLDECSCVAEEVAAGFVEVDIGLQLSLGL
jgi:hypothetical protein